MKPSLFAGDINVDLNMGELQAPLQEDREIFCKTCSLSMGSTAVITACHYARLGGRACFCGLSGDDAYGRFMQKGLEMYQVDGSLVETGPLPTGITVNLNRGRTRSQVTYPGTIEVFNGREKILANLHGFGHIHFAGVYLQTAFRPHILEILKAARERGLSTSLDPQWDSSEKWEYMASWLPHLSYLFVNEDEAMSLTRTSSPPAAFAALKPKTPCPLVKIGPRGVFYNGKIYPPDDVTVVDTTGAGDTFAGAFLYQVLEQGSSIEEGIKRGNKEASLTCTFPGGLPQNPQQP